MAKKEHTTKVVAKIYADGRQQEDVEENMTLKQMQEFVGGYIEMCPTTIPHRSLVVNEEGALPCWNGQPLPINPRATRMVPTHVILGGGIRGNVLLVKS